MGRSGRKNNDGTKAGQGQKSSGSNDVQPSTPTVTPPVALAAFRAAMAADAKEHGSKNALDHVTEDYLGKLTQSIFTKDPQRDNLYKALVPVLRGNAWSEDRAQHLCDVMWEATRKAAGRKQVQEKAEGETQEALKSRETALMQAREIIAEHTAKELLEEEDRAHRQKQKMLEKSARKASKASSPGRRKPDTSSSDDESSGEALQWIVQRCSAGVETVWSMQESAEGTITDMKIESRTEPSPARISHAAKSLTYSQGTSNDFLSFNKSDDIDDVATNTDSKLPDTGSCQACDLSDLGEGEEHDTEESTCTSRRVSDVASNEEADCMQLADAPASALRCSSSPPRLDHEDAWQCPLQASRLVATKSMVSSSCPASPSVSLEMSARLSLIGSDFLSEQDQDSSAGPVKKSRMQLWPSTPYDTPCCGFTMPSPSLPPLPPWALDELAREDSGDMPLPAPSIPLAPLVSQRKISSGSMDAEESKSSSSSSALPPSFSAAGNSAMRHAVGEPHVQASPGGPIIYYVPVFMPHKCSNCGHICTSTPITAEEDPVQAGSTAFHELLQPSAEAGSD